MPTFYQIYQTLKSHQSVLYELEKFLSEQSEQSDDVSYPPFMDVNGSVSGPPDNKLVHFFFTGDSDYFPAIHLGNAGLDDPHVDQYPVYVVDRSCFDRTEEDYTGSNQNIKGYIQEIIQEVRRLDSTGSYQQQLQQLETAIAPWSDHCLSLSGPISLEDNDELVVDSDYEDNA
jgi:hypothetical protein